MLLIKELILALKQNFKVERNEIRNLLLISLLFGMGLGINGLSNIIGFSSTVYHLFYHIATVFIVFTFFITGMKIYSAITYYDIEFKVQWIGSLVLAVFFWLTNNFLIASIIYLILIALESLIVMGYLEIKSDIAQKLAPSKRNLFCFTFVINPIKDKRIHKAKSRLFSDFSWIYFVGFLFVLILNAIIVKNIKLVNATEAAFASGFILWFMIFNLIPIPPFPGIYMIFAGRTRYVFMLVFLVCVMILMNYLALGWVILISLLAAIITLYFYYHYFEIKL